MPQPKILQDLPPMPPRLPNDVKRQALAQQAASDVPMGAPVPGKEDSLRQTILKAMMEKNPDLMNRQEPGMMGAEGAAGMPPDQAPASADQFLGASGAAPLPPAPPGGPLGDAMRTADAVGRPLGYPVMDDAPAPPEAEARFAGGTGAMDAQIARNLANNRMLAKKAGVTPGQLLEAMPGAYRGERPPPPGNRQAMIEALLSSGKLGMQ